MNPPKNEAYEIPRNQAHEMSNTQQAARYTEYHPRWYRTHVSTWWWLARWPYLKFILREISSVFVAWFVAVFLLQIPPRAPGPPPYSRFGHLRQKPGSLFLYTNVLFFLVFFALYTSNSSPPAMVLCSAG